MSFFSIIFSYLLLDDKKLEPESEEDSDSDECESPELFSLKSPKSLSSARKLFASSRKSRMQYINSKDPAEIESNSITL